MQISRAGQLASLAFCCLAAACTNDVPDSTVVTLPSIPPATAPAITEPVAPTDTTEQPADPAPETTQPPAVEQPVANQQITLEEVGTFRQPMAILNRAGDDLLYVLERAGVVVPVNPVDGAQSRPIVDISTQVASDIERGLLGGAFSPDGTKLYLHWSDETGATRLDEWTMDGPTADPDSRRSLLTVDQPFGNHNGGQVAIGPDGYLYLALGDGGAANDPLGAGQDFDTLLGSIIRIDPEGATGDASYAIPADNPFVSGGGAAEIFLTGVRNPWRFSFDRDTGDLWVADVGQDALEEVTVLRAAEGGGLGKNLGWNLREGSAEFTGPEPADHVGPFYEYPHEGDNCSVTGGYVYRGSAIPGLVGSYVYGDFCVGEIVVVSPNGEPTPLGLTIKDRQLVTFGEDNNGELYAASLGGQLVALRAV